MLLVQFQDGSIIVDVSPLKKAIPPDILPSIISNWLSFVISYMLNEHFPPSHKDEALLFIAVNEPLRLLSIFV